MAKTALAEVKISLNVLLANLMFLANQTFDTSIVWAAEKYVFVGRNASVFLADQMYRGGVICWKKSFFF